MGEMVAGRATGPTGDPDKDAALEMVVATFPDENSASEAFRQIKEAERDGSVLLVDAAVVNRDDGNNLHVRDEQDWPGSVGALLGAGIGSILGTLAGPLGLVVGGAAGAAIGGAAAASSDSGMSDESLKELAKSLRPGASMVVVAVAHFWSKTVADFLAQAGSEVSTVALTDDMARRLDLPA